MQFFSFNCYPYHQRRTITKKNLLCSYLVLQKVPCPKVQMCLWYLIWRFRVPLHESFGFKDGKHQRKMWYFLLYSSWERLLVGLIGFISTTDHSTWSSGSRELTDCITDWANGPVESIQRQHTVVNIKCTEYFIV